MNENIITVSAVRDFDAYEKYVSKNPCCQGMSLSPFDNRVDNTAVPVLYNRFLDGYDYSKEAWFVFCHEDFEFQEDIRPLLERLDKNFLYGPVGAARKGFAGFGMQVLYGNMTEINRDGSGEPWSPGRKIEKPVEVDAFDCCCLIVHSSLVAKHALRFDENLLFDLYVEDFCANAKVNHGIKSFVQPIECRHHSGSKATNRLRRHLPYLEKKYPHNCFVGTLTYFGTPGLRKRFQDAVLKSAARPDFRLLILSAVLPCVLLFAALALLAVNVPYWDDYDAIVRYMGWPLQERMRHLFDFHNEHRIVTVRLFLEAMAATTGKIDFKTCMFFGSAQIAVLFACFAYLYLRQFGKRLGLAVLVFAAWHLFSMLNFDNAFWALTSLENFGVLMWAFLAIVLVRQCDCWFAQMAAIICALLSTLTSAQGLAVFVVLFLSSLVPFEEAGSWRGLLNLIRRASPIRPIAMLLLCVFSVIAYFHGFSSGDVGVAAMESSFVEKILYVVAFLGNLVPIYPLALACGIFVAIGIIYACWCFPKLPSRMRPVFFFMLYCVGVAIAGVFFRATEARAAISFCYYIISACLFISLVGCLLSLGDTLSRFVGKLIPLLAIGFCVLDLAVACVGWSMFKSRNEALRVNILTWPERIDGLRIEEDRQKTASEWLSRLEAKGLYDNLKLLRKGESRPEEPVPWPKPNFP